MLKELLKGWVIANDDRTSTFLGKRNYIGMSDVGKAFGCLRQAVASKVHRDTNYPSLSEIDKMSDEEVQKAVERIRPLERGHEQETGIVSALTGMGVPHIEQLEIRVEHRGVPVVGHLDHVIISSDENIKIIESKSNELIPDVLYPEYEGQIYGQIGLMQRYFNDRVFSVKMDDGSFLFENMSMPEIAKALGIPLLPFVNISGQVLSMNGKHVRPFGPYVPTELMTDLVLRKAVYIWETAKEVKDGLVQLNDLEYVKGFHPLCDYCSHNGDCPKFMDGATQSSQNAAIHQLKELQTEEKAIKERIRAIKEDLVTSYDLLELNGREYVETGDFRYRNGSRNRSSLKQDLLRENLQKDWGLPDDEITQLFESSTVKTSFKQVDIGKINKKSKQDDIAA